jgi:antagonist of KipI
MTTAPTAALRVIHAGLLTTVQDLGRWGFEARGVPVAGALDLRSHRLANLIVGNDPARATLEATLVGPRLEFEDDRLVSVAGAEFELELDGHRVAMGEPLRVGPGSSLMFGARRRGARAYVAVSGGIDVEPVLGSRSTHVASAMGGLSGRALRPGDRVPLGVASSVRERRERWPTIDVPSGHAHVRILAGPQDDHFTSDALETLQRRPYRIGVDSDRIGFRLEGEGLAHLGSAEILSDATISGALQVPGSGLPILLMADRQTTGGYPKLATVISADMGLVGQLAPGDMISFRLCSLRDALRALIAHERAFLSLEPVERA